MLYSGVIQAPLKINTLNVQYYALIACMLHTRHEQSATKGLKTFVIVFVCEETELQKALVLVGRTPARDESCPHFDQSHVRQSRSRLR